MGQWLVNHIPHGIAITIGLALMRAAYPRLAHYWKFDPALWAWLKIKGVFHLPHRRRAAESIRWLIIAGLLTLALGAYYAVVGLITYLGPHEGDPAPPALSIQEAAFAPRHKDTGWPAGENIHFIPNETIYACSRAALFLPLREMTAQYQDENFRMMVAELDLAMQSELRRSETCMQYQQGQPAYIGAEPQGALTDVMVQDWSDGKRSMYILAIWNFHVQGDQKADYVQEFCGFYQSGYDDLHYCPGNHNRTYRHVVK